MPELPPLGESAMGDDGGDAGEPEEVVEEAGDGQELEDPDDGGEPEDTGGEPATPPAADDPYAAYGGKDTVEAAMALHKQVQTDEGVVQVFFQAGRALGLTDEQINTLWGEQQGGDEQPADDELITWGQAKEMLQREVIQPFAKQTQQQAEASARSAVENTLKDLNITDNETAAAVLQLGDRYLNGDISPQNVSLAVKRGHEDFVKLVTKNAQTYVTKKAATAKRVPKVAAGTAGGGTAALDLPEPKSVKEGILRARQKFAAGRLG